MKKYFRAKPKDTVVKEASPFPNIAEAVDGCWQFSYSSNYPLALLDLDSTALRMNVVLENGYYISCIRTFFSYSDDSNWEVEVCRADEGVVYDTPITSDVLNHQDEQMIIDICREVSTYNPGRYW